MYISQTAAQTIVEEIGREINEHINFMDEEGYIVASTDPARLGTLHTGAKRVIEEHLPELYITKEMENATTRKGINLPITIRGEVVGVIGITGEKERVAGYGNIVRRMTEIMVEDNRLKDRKRYDRRVRYRFIEEWIAKSDLSYDRSFVERGYQLGIDVERPRRALVVHFRRYPQLCGTLEGQRRLEEMEATIRHFVDKEDGVLYLREPPKQICLVDECSDDKMRELACHIKDLVYEKYRENVLIGIDAGHGGVHIRQMCDQAQKAVENGRDSDIIFYGDLCVELFLNEISDKAMEEYLDKLFPETEAEELDGFMNLIAVFFEQAGSIGKMAEALYMHKNTIQYKLRKLENLSGKDIRTPEGAGIFYMALQFYKRTKKETNICYR